METLKPPRYATNGLCVKDADAAIKNAKNDLLDRIDDPETFGDPFEICYDHFGIEPDFIIDLM